MILLVYLLLLQTTAKIPKTTKRKCVILLGSTGSIGTNALDVARRFGLSVEVLVAGKNAALLQAQIDEFRPKKVVVADDQTKALIKHDDVRVGEEAIVDVIRLSQSKLVLNALVGFLGLMPTITAIESGKKVALANKESLVVAGRFLDTSKIVPIDSEHFGLWYLQNGRAISSMTITASGGALRDLPLDQVANATLDQVLRHPNWSMGSKITIDSATMTNKLFELLEARWLFGMSQINAVIERSSTVHAMINFVDGSTTMQLANPDMRLPIAYATMGKFDGEIVKPLDITAIKPLEFLPIDESRYPVWQVRKLLLDQPELGVVINAANEVAIEKFVAKKANFGDIAKTILASLEKFASVPNSLDQVIEIDKEVRLWAKSF